MSKPAIDPAILSQLREQVTESDPHFVRDIYKLFIQTTAPRLAAIRSACEKQNGAAVSAEAHALKSSCLSCGATVMTELCRRLEEMGKTTVTAAALDICADLEHEFARVKEEISRWPEFTSSNRDD